MCTHTQTWNGKRKRKKYLENLSSEGEGGGTDREREREWVMSTEMPLLGFLTEMKTHKSTCTHTQTRVTSRCWKFMRGQKNRAGARGKKKVGEKVRQRERTENKSIKTYKLGLMYGYEELL